MTSTSSRSTSAGRRCSSSSSGSPERAWRSAPRAARRSPRAAGTPDTTRSRHPWIICVADAARATFIAQAASASGCGLEVDDQGRVVVWSPSIKQTIALADRLIAARAQFDALPEAVPRPSGGDIEGELEDR